MKDVSKKKDPPVIGITLGDINGIGPEVVIKSLSDQKLLNRLTPLIYGSEEVISFYRKKMGGDAFHFKQIASPESLTPRKINLVSVWDESIKITPGIENRTGGEYGVSSLRSATKDLKEGKTEAIVTAPISKYVSQSSEFNFPGHTEYLAKEVGKKDSLMFLVNDAMRVGVVTAHIPLKNVSEQITEEKLAFKLSTLIHSLKKDFGIHKPVVAVLGLNPHAGENGLLGKEEQEVIIPLITRFKEDHQLVTGPFSADGFFGQGLFRQYDGILAMYHDQGLIPSKLMGFENGVNFTAGLPVVRTSPNHGTAFEIAGKNKANEASFRNAIYLACDVLRNRKRDAEAQEKIE